MTGQTRSNICFYQSFSSKNKKNVTNCDIEIVDEFVGSVVGSHILVAIDDVLKHLFIIISTVPIPNLKRSVVSLLTDPSKK